MHTRSALPSTIVSLFVALALVVASGCSTTYKIRMRGVLPDADQAVAAASRVSIEKVPELNEAEHDPITEKKLVHLLETSGFEVVDLQQADYVLLYNIETNPIADRSSFGAATSGKGGMKITSTPGPFEKSVRLHILNAEPYRKDHTEEVIWSCHAVMPKVPNTSPRFEDMLLAGAFEHFPDDTGAVVTWKIAMNDAEAKELHRFDPVGGN